MVRFVDMVPGQDIIVTRQDQIPEAIAAPMREGERNDLLSPFVRGKAWTFEFLVQHQPRTGELLMNGSEFVFSAIRSEYTGWVSHLSFEVNDQVVEVRRNILGGSPDDNGPPQLNYLWERGRSLPDPLFMAYYYRFNGLHLPDSEAFGAFTRVLPFPTSRPWQSIDGYLEKLKLRKKFLPLVEEMIPNIQPAKKGQPYINFMMFMSSGGSFQASSPREGDAFFVKNHIKDGVIYYIRDSDVANMMILENPAEAIDRYCEHVLMRREERFDFRPWAVPFKAL